MSDLTTEWNLNEQGRLAGNWVFADFANALGLTAPSVPLRGRVICTPLDDLVLTDGDTLGEVAEQVQVVSEADSDVEFFLAPGRWHIAMEVWQLRLIPDVDARVWPGQPLKSRSITLHVEAGVVYDLRHITSSNNNTGTVGVYWMQTDNPNIITVFGNGVSADDDDTTIMMTGVGFIENSASIVLTREKPRP